MAVEREMARLMPQLSKQAVQVRAFAGPEQASIACPKAAPSIKPQSSTDTNRALLAPRLVVLHWVALAL